MNWEILLLVALGGLGWYWYSDMQAREMAIAAGRRACQESALQFLDETVAQTALKFARDGDGVLGIVREYRFEFSHTGADRDAGSLLLRGGRVEWIKFGGEMRGSPDAG